MTDLVQSFNPKTGTWMVFHVQSGELRAESEQPFPDIDEVEPLEDDRPKPMQGYADPLEMMR